MSADEELHEIGFTVQRIRTPPGGQVPELVGIREAPDGSALAVAALEIGGFRISDEDETRAELRWRAVGQAWARCVDALFHLEHEMELWHVVATRRPPGLNGSTLRAGWLVLGRGRTRGDAALAAERSLEVARSIHASHLSFLTLRAATSSAVLLDLVRPATAPFLMALRRGRWEPPTRAALDPQAGSSGAARAGAMVAWPDTTAPWAPIADALASLATHGAFLTRVRTSQRPDDNLVADAQRDVIGVVAEQERLRGSRVDRVTIAGLEPVLRDLRAAAEDRLRTLRGTCLAVDVVLASWEPISEGLAAVASAGLVAPTSQPGIRASLVNQDRLPLPPVVRVDLPAGSLWRPLDPKATPEVLVGPREAASLVRTVEPPTDERSPLPCSRARSLPVRSVAPEGTPLGEAERYGRWTDVCLEHSARFRHVYVVGQTGTGKSTLMLNMVLEDLRAGHGVTVVDPHGTLVADIMARLPESRVDDLVLIDPACSDRDISLNPLDIRAEDPNEYAAHRDRVIDELFDTFDALYDMREAGGPMFETYFRTFMTVLLGGRRPRGYVPILPMLEIIMGTPSLARRLLESLEHDDPTLGARLTAFMRTSGEASISNMVPYVTSKLIRFYSAASARRILCTPDCLDFDDIVRRRKVLLVHLPKVRLGAESASLLARQIVLRLAVSVMSAPRAEAKPHFLFVDEFHNFATERFAQLLSEARKFQLGLVLAHQYTSQLVRRGDRSILDAVLGNVGTFVSFRVGEVDAQLLDSVMAPRYRAQDISGLSNFIACVRSSGTLANVPFTLRTHPPSPLLTTVGTDASRRSAERYGVERTEADRQIAGQLEALRNATTAPGSESVTRVQ